MIALVHAITTQPVAITPRQVIKVIATPIGPNPVHPWSNIGKPTRTTAVMTIPSITTPAKPTSRWYFQPRPASRDEQRWGERPEDPHRDERYDQKRRTDSGFVLAGEPDALMCGHNSQVQDEPGGSATQLLGHTELPAAPCLSEYCGDPDRHRDSPDQECAETEEGPDVLYAGGGSECLAHASVQRVMEAEIANEQVTYAGIACESREVSEADDDQGNDGRE